MPKNGPAATTQPPAEPTPAPAKTERPLDVGTYNDGGFVIMDGAHRVCTFMPQGDRNALLDRARVMAAAEMLLAACEAAQEALMIARCGALPGLSEIDQRSAAITAARDPLSLGAPSIDPVSLTNEVDR